MVVVLLLEDWVPISVEEVDMETAGTETGAGLETGSGTLAGLLITS